MFQMSILGEIFSAIMTDRLKQALARQGQADKMRGTADMRELIKALQDLNNNSDVDLCEGERCQISLLLTHWGWDKFRQYGYHFADDLCSVWLFP